jgi:hypothetical protein
MSKRYPGNFITGNPVALSQTSNNGIWDVKDNYQATTAGTWQEPDGVYEIPRSLRFRKGNSSNLSKTPSVAGNQKTWTFSTWVKIVKTPFSSTDPFYLMGAGSSTPWTAIAVGYDDSTGFPTCIQLSNFAGSSPGLYANVTLRDPSAWYHIIVAVDTAQANQTNRVKFYVNGVEASKVGGTYPTQNSNTFVTGANEHWIGTDGRGGSYFDGYMAETMLVDGQQLDASYFGYFDPITNIWQPKKYTGAYGTNGFYLPFKDTQTLNNLTKNYGAPSNYLPKTDDLTNGTYWANQAVSLSKNATDPFGKANNAYTLTVTAPGYATVYRNNTAPAQNMQWCQSIYVKTGNNYAYTMGMGTEDLATGAVAISAFNSNTGGFVTATTGLSVQGNATNASWGSKYVGNGWYRVWISGRFGATTQLRTDFSFSNGTGATCYIYGPQLNLGTEPDDSYINSSTSATINDWTPNNLSVTAGVTYDSMVDSPTNIATTATDIGGVVSGNYCVLNTVDTEYDHTITNGGLTLSKASSNWSSIRTTHAFSSGKWYFETTYNASWDYAHVGVLGTEVDTYPGQANNNGYVGAYARGWAYQQDARIWNNNTTQGGAPIRCNSGDICMCAVDMDSGKIWFGRNGTWFNSGNPATGTNAAMSGITGEVSPAFSVYGNSSGITINFGQRAFAYTPPTGFKSVNSTNLQALGTSVVSKAALQPNKWFDTTLYGGTGKTQVIKNSGGFQPDIVWMKSRNAAAYHAIADSARGPGVLLASNTAYSEANNGDGKDFAGFEPDGFRVNDYNNWSSPNAATTNSVAWQWKQSPTAGLNIIAYTGNGANNRAISHNLGVAPDFIVVKSRDNDYNWDIFHKDLGIGATLTFTSDATRNYSAFGSTTPTSSNFYTQNDFTNTNNLKYVAYVWTSVPGFSKFGKYTGNMNANGPFVYTGFRPAYVLIKRTDASRNWYIKDNRRPGDNRPLENSGQAGNDGRNANLYANTNGTEDLSFHGADFFSNGFRISTAESATNDGTFIYAAFAESPFALNNRARQ